jgi:hypothetical protein
MRAFADAKGRVRVVERATGKEFTTGTANVFVERDYYTVASEDAEGRRSRTKVIRGCARRGAACRGTWRLVWRGSRVAWRR